MKTIMILILTAFFSQALVASDVISCVDTSGKYILNLETQGEQRPLSVFQIEDKAPVFENHLTRSDVLLILRIMSQTPENSVELFLLNVYTDNEEPVTFSQNEDIFTMIVRGIEFKDCPVTERT